MAAALRSQGAGFASRTHGHDQRRREDCPSKRSFFCTRLSARMVRLDVEGKLQARVWGGRWREGRRRSGRKVVRVVARRVSHSPRPGRFFPLGLRRHSSRSKHLTSCTQPFQIQARCFQSDD